MTQSPPDSAPAPLAAPAADDSVYRTIVDSVAQIMWVSDAGGRVRFFNAHAHDYTGGTSDQLAGLGWLAWIHEDDRAHLRAVRDAGIAAGTAYTTDGRFRRHDGTWRWHRFRVQPLRDGSGTIVGWVGSSQDLDDDHQRAAERERLFAEVARQRALFEAVYSQLPVGVTIAEAPSGRMLYFNAEAERILGHPLRPTGSVGDYAQYGSEHPDGTRYGPEEYATPRALRGTPVRQEQVLYRRGDGRLVTLSVSAEPVRDATGTIVYAVGTFVDVTEHRAAQRELAEREERLRAALAASRTGTFRWDIRTNALEWDENLDRLFGLEPGRTARSLDQFVALVHPADRARVVAACERCAADGADFDETMRVVLPDGSVRWLHDLGRTYRDEAGRPVWVTGACVDVTEQRRREDELRALADTMPQLVWMAGPRGDVDWVNSRWTEFTGVGAEALTHGTASVVHPQDVPDMRDRWMHAVATGAPYEATYRIRRVDGEYSWFMARARATRDENGRVTRWFGSCTDIQDEVATRERLERLHAEAEQARADAQEANRAKGAFLAMMSHDLRTPINATLGYADLLLLGIRGEVSEAQRSDLERIRRSQHALLALVNEVLDFTRLDAGRVEYRTERLPIAELVGEVASMVEVLAGARGITFEAAPVPADAVATGDRDRVRQVLLNLLTNAVKFTPSGGTVRLRAATDDASVRIVVEDTGRGIPADRLASVFEPFVQVESRAPEPADGGGIGLGLAIARTLARGMGGELTAESDEGRGSTFTLALPRAS